MPHSSEEQSLRRETIRQLLQRGPAGTQQALVEELNERGLVATQSSVSRDLRELGAIKTPRGYELPDEQASNDDEFAGEPYLLAYAAVRAPDESRRFLGVKLDLDHLRHELLPEALRSRRFGRRVAFVVESRKGRDVYGHRGERAFLGVLPNRGVGLKAAVHHDPVALFPGIDHVKHVPRL